MAKRILVIEGNAEDGSARIKASGGQPYNESYTDVLRTLSPSEVCVPVFPSEQGADALPTDRAFGDFDGAVWTGSSLDAFKDVPPTP